jgi:hypothetical protein
MHLNDVRKLAIRRQARVSFTLRNGLVCVVNEHGIATVPELRSFPQFNIEEEFSRAETFTLERVRTGREKTREIAVERLTRRQLEELAAGAGQPVAAHPESDE